MNDAHKTKAHLLEEVTILRQRLARFEAAEAEHTRALIGLERSSVRLHTLHEIHQAILVAQSPQEIAQAALPHIRRLIPCQRSSVLIFDQAFSEPQLLATLADNPTRIEAGAITPLHILGNFTQRSQEKVWVIEDFRDLPSLSPIVQTLQAEGLRSVLSVSMLTEGELIGLLNLWSATAGAFTPEHSEIACEVADSLVIAIQQARLQETTRRYVAQLHMLHEISRDLTRLRHLDELLTVIVQQAAQWLNAYGGGILLYRPELQVLEWVLTAGYTSVQPGTTMRYGEGLAGRVWATRAPMRVDNYSEWLGRSPQVQGSVEAVIEVPIQWSDEFLGVLALGKHLPHRFTENDEELLSQFAAQAAIAIHNAQLYDQSQRYATELKEKNEELEAFAYTVSHDLKSPLVTIGGFLGYLEQDVSQGDHTRITHDITRMRESIDHMRRLIDELLKLSRIGRVSGPPQAVGLGELVREALAQVEIQRDIRGLQVDLAPELPEVWGDRQRLVEVLQNLLDNAIKFMGRQVSPLVEIGGRLEEKQTVCYVRDNGEGIEPQYHQRVFQLFERLSSAGEGTGIGLAVVKRIIEAHGGEIWVESPGRQQGSTFYFTLPRLPAGAAVRSVQ